MWNSNKPEYDSLMTWLCHESVFKRSHSRRHGIKAHTMFGYRWKVWLRFI
jgi:hypothetical protein